jgi:serine protease inhibitor ecotin
MENQNHFKICGSVYEKETLERNGYTFYYIILSIMHPMSKKDEKGVEHTFMNKEYIKFNLSKNLNYDYLFIGDQVEVDFRIKGHELEKKTGNGTFFITELQAFYFKKLKAK